MVFCRFFRILQENTVSMRRILVIAVCMMAAVSVTAQEKPVVYMVPNAHMDTQWRWDFQRTIGEFIPNTLLQNFSL